MFLFETLCCWIVLTSVNVLWVHHFFLKSVPSNHWFIDVSGKITPFFLTHLTVPNPINLSLVFAISDDLILLFLQSSSCSNYRQFLCLSVCLLVDAAFLFPIEATWSIQGNATADMLMMMNTNNTKKSLLI